MQQQIHPHINPEDGTRSGYPPLARTVLGGYLMETISGEEVDIFLPVYWDGKYWIDALKIKETKAPITWMYMPYVDREYVNNKDKKSKDEKYI